MSTSNASTMSPIDETMGAMFIGLVVSAVLYGVSLVQTFFYYMNYPKDVWYIKALVGLTALLDTLHLALISHTIYHYLVTNYFNPPSLQLMIWSLLLEALFTGLTGALVQAFYTARIWRLSKRNIPLTFGILFLVIANAGCGTAWVILSLSFKTFEHLLSISGLTLTINAISTVVDVVIAASLCIMLNNARTGFKKSDTIINRLTLFIVNTGVLTSCCALASLISLLASPNSLVYASFYFCIGRLYTNSFLATLNARKSLKGNADDISHMLVSLSSSAITPPASVAMRGVNRKISIRVDTTNEAMPDERTVGVADHLKVEDGLSNQKGNSL